MTLTVPLLISIGLLSSDTVRLDFPSVLAHPLCLSGYATYAL